MTTKNNNNNKNNKNNNKNELYKWIEESGMYGTWTFTTQTMTDVGYYKGIGYFIIHIMPNPMQVNSCSIIQNNNNNNTSSYVGDHYNNKTAKTNAKTKTNANDTSCIEADNYACHYNNNNNNNNNKEEEGKEEECINTETSQVEWSDVTVFFQYGFRLRTGIVHKTYHNVNTDGNWLGPYNIILAPVEVENKVDNNKDEKDNEKEREDDEEEEEETETEKEEKHQMIFVSRYVNTPWTKSQLQRPSYANIFESNPIILENVIGTKVINTTIQKVQKTWNDNDNGSNGNDNDNDNGNGNGNGNGNHNDNGKLNGNDKLNNGNGHSSIATTQRQRQRRGLLRQEQGDDSTTTANNDDDPYSKYIRNCDHGDIQPILPRLQLERTTSTTTDANAKTTQSTTTSYSMSIDYSILSLPEKNGINNDLYKLWPIMKKHLGSTFPLYGPYCYGKDPNRAYAIRLSFDSQIGNNTTSTAQSQSQSQSSPSSSSSPPLWSGVKGCVPPWPCWNGDDPSPPGPSPGPSPTNKIPTDNGNTGKYVIDPLSITAFILYFLGSLLVISLIFNLLLSNRLIRQRLQQQQPSGEEEEEQEIDRRYDLEEVVGGATSTSTGSGNGNDQDGDNNNSNNTSNLNDRLEEPLLPSSSSTNNIKNKAEESFSDYYRNEEEEGRNEATTTATTTTTNQSTSVSTSSSPQKKQQHQQPSASSPSSSALSALSSGVDESKQEA